MLMTRAPEPDKTPPAGATGSDASGPGTGSGGGAAPATREPLFDPNGIVVGYRYASGHSVVAQLVASGSPSCPDEPNPDEPKEDGTVAQRLVRLALAKYRLGVTREQEPFAVERGGPNVAIMFRGSRDALKSSLAREYYRLHDSVASAGALGDALTTLQGEAERSQPEPVYLRLAEFDGCVVLDLGGPSGRAVVVGPSGWEVLDRSPVLFRRTALTAELPVPQRGGTLEDLRALLNVSREAWALAVGVLVASLIPSMDHPIVLVSGLQGTGKTTAARFLAGLVDASTAPVRSAPRDTEQWAIACAGSWAVVLDNLSSIPEWLSDVLCKSCTGDGWIRRKLYTDGDLVVLSFRRVVFLTSIDAGALRGDLADRLLLLDLEPIPDHMRRSGRELDQIYDRLRPHVLGALLDLLARVLGELPAIGLAGMPRMADFARVLAAVDGVRGTRSLDLYVAQRDRIAVDVVEADAFGEALVTFMMPRGEWSGTASELLKALTPERTPKGWPKDAARCAGQLRRIIPALESAGVQVIPPSKTDKTRRYTLRSTARAAQTAETAPGDGARGESARAVGGQRPSDRPGYRPDQSGPGAPARGDSRLVGGTGGAAQPLSEGASGDSFDRIAGPARTPENRGEDPWRS